MADEQFYTILTNIGKAKVANAALLSSNVTLKTLKVGDGNGAYYNPTEDQKDLKNTVYTCNVGSVSVDKDNPNWILAETIIPGSVGGFTIREVGLFDTDGDMIAIGKYPETYKPVVANGASKDLNVRTIFEVSNAESVTLNLDPSVIIATKDDISNLQKKITSNDNDIINLQKQITSNDDDIINLQKQITSNNNNITNLQKQVSSESTDITNLKNGLYNVTKVETISFPLNAGFLDKGDVWASSLTRSNHVIQLKLGVRKTDGSNFAANTPVSIGILPSGWTCAVSYNEFSGLASNRIPCVIGIYNGNNVTVIPYQDVQEIVTTICFVKGA